MKKSTTEKGGAAPSGLAAPTPSVVLFMFGQVGYSLSAISNGVLPLVCVAIARAVFESSVQGVCLSAGAQRRHLYQDKHTSWCHYPR